MQLLKPGKRATISAVRKALGGRAQPETDAAVAALSAGKQKQLWEALAEFSAEAIGADDFADKNEAYAEEPDEAGQFAKLLDALKLSAAAALGWVKDKDHHVPTTFLPLAEALHEAVFVFKGPAGDDARTATLRLCSCLWEQRRKGSEVVTTQTLPCLLLLANSAGATDADVKRCHAMREALTLVDMDDDSASGLKEILAQAFVNPAFLRSREGRSVLVFVMVRLADTALPDAYAAVINHLPYCHASELEAYGSLILRAWNEAGEGADEGAPAARACIEEAVIQDLLVRGVTAARTDAFKAVRRVLAPLLKAKKVPEVDAMVARLYGPVIWRAVEAASPAARGNALALLVDAFPVADPTGPKSDVDEAMQRNFAALYRLLADPVPTVRAAAAQGACRVLSAFWELMPPATTKKILARVAGECARDSASVAVRAAAIDGLAFLLDQVLSHPVMASLLPVLAPLLHDRSERVRASFLALLLRVQSLRSIRFYDVVAADDLMARLVLDAGSPRAQEPLVRLLAPTFLPTGASASDLITRVVRCMRRHPSAGIAFYSSAHLAATPSERARLALVLHKALRKAVDTAASAKRGPSSKPSALDARNTALMAHLASVFRAVWAGLRRDVLHPSEAAAASSGADEAGSARSKLLRTVTPASLLGLLEGIVGSADALADASDDAESAAAAAAALLGVAASLGDAAADATLDAWAWPVLRSAAPGSRLHSAAVDAVCGMGMGQQLLRRCADAVAAGTAAVPAPAGDDAVAAPASSLASAAQRSAALGSGRADALGWPAAVACLDRVLAADPSGQRAATLADPALRAALETALSGATAFLSAALAAPEEAAAVPAASLAAAVGSVRCLARLSAHACAAETSPAGPGFAAGASLAALTRWVMTDALPAAAAACVTASTADLEEEASCDARAAAGRAVTDAAAVVASVLADCAAMGSAGDATVALLSAVADPAFASAAAAVAPPPSLVHAVPSSAAEAASGRAESKAPDGRPEYDVATHGGSVLCSSLLRLAARAAAASVSQRGLTASGSASAAAEASVAAALALLAAASACAASPRLVFPTLAAASASDKTLQDLASRNARQARAVWAGCCRRMAGTSAGPTLARVVGASLPAAITALGSDAAAVGDAFASLADACSPLSGVAELGAGLRDVVAPLLGDAATREALLATAAASLVPSLAALADAAEAAEAQAAESDTGASAEAHIRASRAAAVVSSAGAAASPWLAVMSAACAELGQDHDSLRAVMSGGGDLRHSLERAGKAAGGGAAAVAEQLFSVGV